MSQRALLLLSPAVLTIDQRDRVERLVQPMWFDGQLDALRDDQLRGIEILITGPRTLSADALRRLPDLQLILVTGTGFEWVDSTYCEANDVMVCNTSAYTGSAVAEHAFALFMTLAKRVVELDRIWKTTAADVSFGVELSNKTAGVVGYGDVGERIGRYAAAFGMDVVYVARSEHHDPNARRVDLDELLGESHVVFLALPETDETSGMLDTAAFERMRCDAFLVNISADGLVDRAALLHALDTRGIAGAAVDIVDPPAAYADVAHLIVTPARGWFTPECVERRASRWLDTLQGYVTGDPTSVVIGRPTSA